MSQEVDDPFERRRISAVTPIPSLRPSRPERRLVALVLGGERPFDPGFVDRLSETFRVVCCDEPEAALAWIRHEPVDVVLVRASVAGSTDGSLLRDLHGAVPARPSVFVVVFDSIDEDAASSALENGATDVWCGLPIGSLARARTVTLAREVRLATAEVELTETRQKLFEASQLKSEFFSTMSHELRTPLNAIIGFSEMMKDGLAGPLSAKQSDFIEHVFRAGGHLLELIDEILDLSKLETGRLRLDFEEVELDRIIDIVFSDAAERAKARELTLVRDAAAESVRLDCDPRRMKQILAIFVANAITSANRATVVTVGIRAMRLDEVASGFDGIQSALPNSDFDAFVEISVEHVGRVLPRTELAGAFMPLGGADPRATKATENDGLGLALVSRLAEVHGGAAGASSLVDVGTRFVVWLPLRVAGLGE